MKNGPRVHAVNTRVTARMDTDLSLGFGFCLASKYFETVTGQDDLARHLSNQPSNHFEFVTNIIQKKNPRRSVVIFVICRERSEAESHQLNNRHSEVKVL